MFKRFLVDKTFDLPMNTRNMAQVQTCRCEKVIRFSGRTPPLAKSVLRCETSHRCQRCGDYCHSVYWGREKCSKIEDFWHAKLRLSTFTPNIPRSVRGARLSFYPFT